MGSEVKKEARKEQKTKEERKKGKLEDLKKKEDSARHDAMVGGLDSLFGHAESRAEASRERIQRGGVVCGNGSFVR